MCMDWNRRWRFSGVNRADKYAEVLQDASTVLSAFCEADGGSVDGLKMAVTESDVLRSWKKFYQTGTNWKDVNKC